MKKVFVISFSDLDRDARVKRQLSALKKKYNVTVACLNGAPVYAQQTLQLKAQKLTLVRKLKIAFFLVMRMFNQAQWILHPYRYLVDELKHENFNLVIANDAESLPLAFEIAQAQKKPSDVFLDAHEYAPRHFEDRFWWKLLFQPLNVYLCRTYIPKVSAMTTIGRGLANEYEKHFSVKPDIITNANRYAELNPSPVKEGTIRMVHHGVATPSRKLEIMIEMMDYVDERFTLDMYLLSQGFSSKKTIGYPEKLKQLAEKNGRVRILAPIASENIVPAINSYDIGVFLIPPINFNYANTLPNKLFDFIQARLAIAVGPTPEMAEIVNQYNIGVVSEDFSAKALAHKLNRVTLADLQAYKQNTTPAARELNAEKNEEHLLALIDKLMQNR